MRAALWAEAVKLASSLVGRVGTVAIVGGIAVLCGALLLAVHSGDAQLVAKLGPAADGGWSGLLAAAAQVTGAGGLLGFGVVLAWMFGREFGEGTVTGFFALPIRRSTIAAAKLAVYGLWATLTSLALVAALLVVGVVSALGAFPVELWPAVARQFALTVMTAAVATPVAWAATAGRSLLAGVSAAIGIVIVAQVSVLAGAGGWMPLAAPALWAVSAGNAVSTLQLLLLVPVVVVVAGATMWAWERLQLDR
ncbi:ABC transporter permease [Homoserinimonas sp. A520]